MCIRIVSLAERLAFHDAVRIVVRYSCHPSSAPGAADDHAALEAVQNAGGD